MPLRVKIQLPSHENRNSTLMPNPTGNQIIPPYIFIFIYFYVCTRVGFRAILVIRCSGLGVGLGVMWLLPVALFSCTQFDGSAQQFTSFLNVSLKGGSWLDECVPRHRPGPPGFGRDDVETRRFCGMAMASNKAVGGISIFRDIQWDIMGVMWIIYGWRTIILRQIAYFFNIRIRLGV